MKRLDAKFAREVQPLFDEVRNIYKRRHGLVDEVVIQRGVLIRFCLDEIDKLGASGVKVDFFYVADRNITAYLPYQPEGDAETIFRTTVTMSDETFGRLNRLCAAIKDRVPTIRKNVYRPWAIRAILRAVVLNDRGEDIAGDYPGDPIVTTAPLDEGSATGDVQAIEQQDQR